MNRPIITISLLPFDWSQKKYLDLFKELVEVLKEIKQLGIASERDVYINMPKDHLTYGIDGREIVVQARIPMHRPLPDLPRVFREAFEKVLKKHLPTLQHFECAVDMPPAEKS